MRWAWAGCALILMAGTAAAATTRKVPQDYETIQAAVDAADSGDTILVSKKPGGAAYHENVVTDKSLRFVGRGVVWDGYPLPGDEGGYGPCLLVSGEGSVDDVLVQGFVFRNGSGQVHIEGDRAVVQKCIFRNSGNWAVFIIGDDARILKTTFRGNGGAINLTGDRCQVVKITASSSGNGTVNAEGNDILVSRSKCLRNGEGTGIYVGGDRASITGNTVTEGGPGIEVSGDDALVDGNRVAGVSAGSNSAIHVLGTRARVTGNQAIRTSGNGIAVFADAGGPTDLTVIEGNTVSGADRTGIYGSGASNSIRDNRVNHIQNYGIECHGWETEPGSVVEGNTVADCFDSGIFGTGAGIQFVGNRVSGVIGAGIECQQAGTAECLVRDNTIEGCFGNGVRLDATGAAFRVEGNTISAILNWYNGVQVDANGPLTGAIDGNRIFDVSGSGIRLSAGSPEGPLGVTGNTIAGCGTNWDYGIYVYTSGATIAQNRVTDQEGAGIYAGGGANTLDRNTAVNCSKAGISVFDNGSTVTDNTATGSDGEGFANYGSNTVLTGNTFLRNRTDVASYGTFATPDIGAVNVFQTGGVDTPIQIFD